MFEVNNGTTNINGSQGIYDEKTVSNPSTRYGRNAVDNYYSYLEQPIIKDVATNPKLPDLANGITDEKISEIDNTINEQDAYIKSLPPLEFEYRYMPNVTQKGIDKRAILGAAYEDLGKKTSISVEEFDNTYLDPNTATSKGMDINNDGKIDVAEYGLSIVAADMLGKSDTPDINNIDGTISPKGFSAVYNYAQKSNLAAAKQLYSNLNAQLGLTETQKDFAPEG